MPVGENKAQKLLEEPWYNLLVLATRPRVCEMKKKNEMVGD